MLELALLLFVAAMVCSVIIIEHYPNTSDWLDGLTFCLWSGFSATMVVAIVGWIIGG